MPDTKPMIRILYRADNPPETETILAKLEAGGLVCELVRVANQTQFIQALAGEAFDVVLCDYQAPYFDALAALNLAREQQPLVPVIMISDSPGEEEAVKCLQQGATDYLVQQRLGRLPSAVKRAIHESTELRRNRQAEQKLAASERHLRAIIEAEPECVKLLSADGLLLEMNPAGLRMIEADSPDQVIGRPILGLILPEYRTAFTQLSERVLRGESGTLEFEIQGMKGTRRWLETRAVPLPNEQGNPGFILGITRDITARRQAEQLLAWETRALGLIASTASLAEVLGELMLGLEQQSPGALCSVLILDAEGLHLRHGAGPSLPPAYIHAINGVAIGPQVGSCGTAAHGNRQVIVVDIDHDPLWANYRELALGHGLRACWSTPIPGSGGNLLGTFAIYYRTQRCPTPAELELIERAKNIVSLAIERKQTAERVGQSEERLANAQRMAKLGSWELDLSQPAEAAHRRLHWSDEVFRIFGYQPGEIEVSNENFFRAVHPDDRPRIHAAMALAVRQRQPYQLIHRIILPDHTERIVQEQSEIHFDPSSGKALKMVGTVQDITALKTIEQALEDSETLYHSLVEHLPMSVFRKDQQGRIIFANARFCAAVGKSLKEVLGQTDFEIAPADLAQKYRDDDRRVMETGAVLEMVEENRFLPGKARVIQVFKAPLRNRAGEIVGIQGLFLDITERRELEEQLRQSQKMDAIGQLAGGVAHDFNNLLTIIQGYSQLLLTQDNLPTYVAEPLQQIYIAGERAADLTRQLLTFSRKQSMNPRALDLNESVRNMTKMLQRIIGENITLQCAFAPVLPSVMADAGMIDQILLNLSVNARDAMSDGGRLAIETGIVELDAKQARHQPGAQPGRFVCLSIRDTGSGIAAEHIAHIFEPFFTTKDVGKGTGLGLATVFGIVQQHHGWMAVNSAVGSGTTFKVFLPTTATATPTTETAHKVRGGSETILVVEDDEALRHIVLIVLRNHGYRVLEAASGVKALGVWEQHAAEIDMMLTDLVMPDGVTGRELAEQLRTKRPNLKVIYTSGYSPDFAGSDLVLKEGINFLQKPYRPQKLARTVRDCLDA